MQINDYFCCECESLARIRRFSTKRWRPTTTVTYLVQNYWIVFHGFWDIASVFILFLLIAFVVKHKPRLHCGVQERWREEQSSRGSTQSLCCSSRGCGEGPGCHSPHSPWFGFELFGLHVRGAEWSGRSVQNGSHSLWGCHCRTWQCGRGLVQGLDIDHAAFAR